MQPGATTCTEDRIQHALDRCLHGLSLSRCSTSWSAGLCLNCWSLQELVSRDPGHFLILLEQILQKTREVQEKGTYDLLAPLALLFYSTVLCTPHFPPDSDLLLKAARTYHRFLTWPVPYCSICQELLTFIDAELKAPGISYQRLVRAEQGLSIRSHRSSTVTVLLLNPVEVQAEFLAVANRLSAPGHSPHSAYTTLLLHAFQATFGPHCDLPGLHCRLQSKSLAELEDIFTETAEAQELASSIGDAAEARQWLRTKLQAVGEKAGFPGVLDTAKPGKLCTIPIPVARCHTYNWNQDSFDVLQEILLQEQELLQPGILGDEEEEEDDDDDDLETEGRCAQRDSLLSTSSAVFHDSTLSLASSQASEPTLPRQLLTSFVSGLSDGVDSGYVEDSEDSSSSEWPKRPGGQGRRLHRRPGQKFNRIYKLFKSTSQLVLRRDSRGAEGGADAALPLRRAGSLCGPLDGAAPPPASRPQRSRSLPQPKLSAQLPSWLLAPASRHQRRRPFLSGDEDPKASTLRVVVFGSDRISGKVARAYSNLRRLENNRPLLTRLFKLQFFYVPVKRGSGACPSPASQTPPLPADSPRQPSPAELESTNDISHYLGMLDPWYERNVLGLMHLPPEVLCQQSLKAESRPLDGSSAQLPILADMLLYYCRFAARPVLLQVYQTELTFVTGEKMTEIFLHSLELGHSAATRAIKASGPGSKRLGIDGDREAIPLTLQIIYSKVRPVLGARVPLGPAPASPRGSPLCSWAPVLQLGEGEGVDILLPSSVLSPHPPPPPPRCAQQLPAAGLRVRGARVQCPEGEPRVCRAGVPRGVCGSWDLCRKGTIGFVGCRWEGWHGSLSITPGIQAMRTLTSKWGHPPPPSFLPSFFPFDIRKILI
uniref:Phosphoinositide 3-kinase regulatory subunit 5 n=1 Tax=Panthera leo TaxID=9689 RepID=A0A8C8XHI6_PANLE